MKNTLSTILKALSYQIAIPFVVAIVIVFLSGLLTVNIIRKYPETFGLLKGPSIIQEEEEELVEKVGGLISLPEEKPVIAIVTEEEKLQGQTFFANAEKGDKVLIYTEAKKVILYRPSENRVVEVGTVNINNEGEIEGAVITNKFVLLNGTQTEGLTLEFEGKLANIYPDAEVVNRTTAKNSDYKVSILVDLKGNRNEVVELLLDKLDLQIGELPSGEEVAEDVDFVIIVGAEETSEVEE